MTFFEAYEQMKRGKIVSHCKILLFNGEKIIYYFKLDHGIICSKVGLAADSEYDQCTLIQKDLDATDWEVVE